MRSKLLTGPGGDDSELDTIAFEFEVVFEQRENVLFFCTFCSSIIESLTRELTAGLSALGNMS